MLTVPRLLAFTVQWDHGTVPLFPPDSTPGSGLVWLPPSGEARITFYTPSQVWILCYWVHVLFTSVPPRGVSRLWQASTQWVPCKDTSCSPRFVITTSTPCCSFFGPGPGCLNLCLVCHCPRGCLVQPMSQLYQGQYRVLCRADKFFTLEIGSWTNTVSILQRSPPGSSTASLPWTSSQNSS